MIQHDVDLSRLNSLRLPARAVSFARIEQVSDISAALAGSPADERLFVLGGGSNVVLTGDFKGLVLQIALTGRALTGEDGDAWYVTAGAGENWHEFVQWTLAQGWPGLENLSLIPGTVGAAPIQNIGAYGVEVGELIQWVEAVDPRSGTPFQFGQRDCAFGYRDSLWKKQGWHRSGERIITRVTFRLPKRWQAATRYGEVANELAAKNILDPDARQVARVIEDIRRRKLPDPAIIPNAGSFFQNPVVDVVSATKLAARYPDLPRYRNTDAEGRDTGKIKLAAGWLIEQAGWKGRGLGPVGMYEKQALVLVNLEPGMARGTDVGMLAEAVRTDVHRKFGVWLNPEPIFF